MAAHSSAAHSTSFSSETSCRTTLQSCSRLCLLTIGLCLLPTAAVPTAACAYCSLCLLPTAAVLTLATLTMAVLTGAVLIVAVFSMAILTTGQRGAV